MCMVSCPFGAISDKSQIFQLSRALREGKKIIAEVAPAFVGQFGKDVTPAKFKAALIKLGFQEVYEVARGADIGAIAEAHHYAEKVSTGELPFLLTSCCPTAAEAVDLQQDLLLPLHDLIQLILIFLNLTTQGINIGLIIRELLLELG